MSSNSSSVSDGKPTIRSVVSTSSGHGLPQSVGQTEVAVPVVAATHRLEDAVVAGLHRQVQVLAHRFEVGERPDQPGRDVLGMRGHEADAGESRHVSQRLEQVGEVLRPGESRFPAVGVHVLAEQRHFAHAPLRQSPHFLHDVAGRAAGLRSAHVGHDAVRAEVGAAGHDLDPGQRALPPHRRKIGAPPGGGVLEGRRLPAGRQALLEEQRQLVQALGADQYVHVRVLDEERVLTALRQTPRHHHKPAGIFLLQPPRLAQMAQKPGVGLLPDGAGVVDEEAGLLGPRHLTQTDAGQQAADALRVVLVHLAPEGAHVEGIGEIHG